MIKSHERVIGESAISVVGPVTNYILGPSGKKGDLLRGVHLVRKFANSSLCSVKDGILASMVISTDQAVIFGMPVEGVTLEMDFDMVSVNGGWSITLGAGCNAVVTGVFS